MVEENWTDHMQSLGSQPTFMYGLMSDLVICKFRKSMVVHDSECPYWDQVSLNNSNPFTHIHQAACVVFMTLNALSETMDYRRMLNSKSGFYGTCATL